MEFLVLVLFYCWFLSLLFHLLACFSSHGKLTKYHKNVNNQMSVQGPHARSYFLHILQLCIHQKQQKESTRYTGKASRLPKIIYQHLKMIIAVTSKRASTNPTEPASSQYSKLMPAEVHLKNRFKLSTEIFSMTLWTVYNQSDFNPINHLTLTRICCCSYFNILCPWL